MARYITIVIICFSFFSAFYYIHLQQDKEIEKEAAKMTRERDQLLHLKSEYMLLTKENSQLKSELYQYKKVAYLTFDDGPSVNTLSILKTLEKEGAKATFFVNGREEPENIAIYQKIVDEGHAIGNHTYSHQYSTIYQSPELFLKDFSQLEVLLREKAGAESKLYRFPGGSTSSRHISKEVHNELSKKGYIFFDWNIDSRDSASGNPSKEFIVSSVLEQAKGKDKALILFHDSKAKTNTAHALPTIIKELKKQGYVFDVLSEDSFNRQFILER